MFSVDHSEGKLYYDGHYLHPRWESWIEAPVPSSAEQISSTQAVAWVQKYSGLRIKQPVTIIGPEDATEEQIAVATEVGALVGRMGMAVLCSGEKGVVEGASRGVDSVGGVAIGLLPNQFFDPENSSITVSIPTGIGHACNAVTARACACLIAVGNDPGTLSAVALGLQFRKRVFGLAGAPRIDGVVHLANLSQLESALARALLQPEARTPAWLVPRLEHAERADEAAAQKRKRPAE